MVTSFADQGEEMKASRRGKANGGRGESNTAVAEPRPPSQREAPMAVVVRDVPPGFDWGFYSREDPRMHLQTVSRKQREEYKVWLEAKGKPVFEPDSPIPAKVLKKLQAEVTRRRPGIEADWVSLMIQHGWLRCQFRKPVITLTAYPGYGHRFERTIDIAEEFAPEFVARLGPNDVRLNDEYAVIEFEPHRPEGKRLWISLPEVLWPR
jgi:hypothetical protein